MLVRSKLAKKSVMSYQQNTDSHAALYFQLIMKLAFQITFKVVQSIGHGTYECLGYGDGHETNYRENLSTRILLCAMDRESLNISSPPNLGTATESHQV